MYGHFILGCGLRSGAFFLNHILQAAGGGLHVFLLAVLFQELCALGAGCRLSLGLKVLKVIVDKFLCLFHAYRRFCAVVDGFDCILE